MTASSRCRWSPARSSRSSPPRSTATPSSSTSGDTSAYSSTLNIKPALGQYTYGTPDVLPARAGRLPALLPRRRHPDAHGQQRGRWRRDHLGRRGGGARRRPGADGLRAVGRRRAMAAGQRLAVPRGHDAPPAGHGQERLHPAGAADLDGPAGAALRHRPAAGRRGRRRPGQRRRQGGGGGPADHRPVPGRARPRRQRPAGASGRRLPVVDGGHARTPRSRSAPPTAAPSSSTRCT